MRVAILWSGNEKLLAQTMEELITQSQCYLFSVICGGQSSERATLSASYKWATANGAPVEFLIEENLEKLIDKLVAAADFLVAYNDGNQITKRIIMKFKSAGKHGKVVSA